MKSPLMRSFVCMVMLGWMSIAFAADTARAWLDRSSMRLGETVTLNVETTDSSASAPDFSALGKDFEVGGTQSSQQVNIVNGARSAKMLWAVALQPRHQGRITIAPFAVGSASTAALTLDVGAAPPPAQAGGDVFFEVDAQPRNPWVQQQVRYTVKLYYAVDLTGGNIDPPKADGLSVQHLGQDKQYVANVGGKRYQVVEQHYALTPERSGTIELPALLFRGTALDLRDPNSFFNRGRQISARSEAITLDVRGQPADWPADKPWLPAASLILQDESDLPATVHVGDAITRTIRMQAQGLGYAQLPELQLPAITTADVYPDKSDTRTRDDGTWLFGERVRKFAIVPRTAGSLTVPGISVSWWNTQTDRIETAQLPERTIEVLPAVAGSVAAVSTPPSAAGTSPTAAPGVAPAPQATPANPFAPLLTDSQARFWRLVAWVMFAIWLVTVLGWGLHVRHARAMRPEPVSDAAANARASTHRAAFLRACSLGELAAAERALVAWSRSERSQVRNLGELAQLLGDARQRDALMHLQRVRYAGACAEGLGAQLQQAFRGGLAWPPAELQKASDMPLPALYPERE
ncbi:MAG: protein BatD [Dokdonella sp.]|nr:protein BatD [Dokdonella sp.]